MKHIIMWILPLFIPSLYASSECVALSSDSICAPLGGYINTTALSIVYGVHDKPLDVKSWESLLKQLTTKSDLSMKMWQKWADCTGYQGEPIQYYLSYLCLTDIHVFSKGCAQPQPTLCRDVCHSYGSALEAMLSNPVACPLDHVKANTQLYQRRSSVEQALSSCTSLTSPKSCSMGVHMDAHTCGFAGDAKVADSYCGQYPQAACCQKKNTTVPSTLGKVAMAWGIDSATSSASEPSFLSRNAGGLIAIVVSLVVIVALGGFLAYFLMKRNRNYNRRISSFGKKESDPLVAGMTQVQMTPSNLKYKVVHDFKPTLPDELNLKMGDLVELEASFDDGWAKARNITSGLEGTCPLGCLELIKE